jgi:hypothetical protein
MNAEKLAYDEFISPPWAGENADDISSNSQWPRQDKITVFAGAPL